MNAYNVISRLYRVGNVIAVVIIGKRIGLCRAFANEIAVEAFLKNRIGFLDIARTCRTMMDTYQPTAVTTLEEILAIDLEARARTREVIV